MNPRGRLDDLTSKWAMDSHNPQGPKPDNPKATHYTELDQQRWNLEALYGRQDDGPRTRKGRTNG